MNRVVIDTGPLVAYLVHEEEHHAWAVEQFGLLSPPLLTCEPVLTEAAYLLSQSHGGSDALLELIDRGVLEIRFDLASEIEPVRRLMRRYRSTPMSLADACLVRMSELHERARVFTLDADFKLYRRHGRQAIPLIIP